MPKLLRPRILLLPLVLFVFFHIFSSAAAEDFLPTKGAATVSFNHQPLFTLQPIRNQYSTEERARIIMDRIQEIADDETATEPPTWQLVENPGSTRIILGGKLLMLVFEEEAALENMPRRELAETRAKTTENAIRQYQTDLHPQNLMLRFGASLLATLAGLILWKMNNWFIARLDSRLNLRREKAFPILKYIMLSEQFALYFLNRLAWFLLWLLRLLLLYGYIYVVLSIFPITREYANIVLSYLWQPLTHIGSFIIDFLPNLATIFIILILFWYILGFIRLFCREIEKGHIVFGGFHPEWASSTYALVRLLVIALAFIAIFPYIPGSNSPVFQGMSVFLGLLFSVSSSSALSNIVAGYVLIYTRAFKEGDVIRSGEYCGIVVHQALLATSVRTFKNEVVTIPNSLLLGSSIVNYNRNVAEKGLTLHTTITIGYDVPWRKVHELLKDAANRTEGLCEDPPPFVLQTALNDFHVSYQLNAFTRSPEIMGRLYSAIHQNIQDCFQEAGVEIMSPHYSALRNGNATTIPPSAPAPDEK